MQSDNPKLEQGLVGKGSPESPVLLLSFHVYHDAQQGLWHGRYL